MIVAILFSKATGLQFEVSQKHVQLVRNALPSAEIYLVESTQELVERSIDPDILITWITGGGHFNAADFCCQSKNLKCFKIKNVP